MTTARWLMLLAAGALGSACYTYAPASFDGVAAGANIRVYLTRQGVSELGESLDATGPFVTGTLLRRDADQLWVRVPVTNRQVGFFNQRLGQEVTVRTSEIVQLEQRRLDRVGTGLLVAGTAASAATVVLLIIDAVTTEQVDEPLPPTEFRIRPRVWPIRITR